MVGERPISSIAGSKVLGVPYGVDLRQSQGDAFQQGPDRISSVVYGYSLSFRVNCDQYVNRSSER